MALEKFCFCFNLRNGVIIYGSLCIFSCINLIAVVSSGEFANILSYILSVIFCGSDYNCERIEIPQSTLIFISTIINVILVINVVLLIFFVIGAVKVCCFQKVFLFHRTNILLNINRETVSWCFLGLYFSAFIWHRSH